MKRSPVRVEWAPKSWTVGVEWFIRPRWALSRTRYTVYLCLLPLHIIFEFYRDWTELEKQAWMVGVGKTSVDGRGN